MEMRIYCDNCYIADNWGGSAMTTSKCKVCGREVLYGSTNVDYCCKSCAETREICVHCGVPL